MIDRGGAVAGTGGDEVIWLRSGRAARGPRPAHSLADIAGTGVRVADADGLDAVSMRRIAAELGSGTTSLYRYVSSKDDILDLMYDAVLGEEELPPPRGYWPADLTAIAHRMRGLMIRHPWMTALAGRPSVGPNGLYATERALRAVDGLGLSIDEMVVLIEALEAYVLGYVTRELADRAATRRSGRDWDQWMAAHARYGRTIIDGGRFPLVARAWLDAREPHARDRQERGFRHGLERLLDGIGARIRAARD
ncbi:TetR/AcrR family transcriptional regulator [Amycolatopsis sp. NPDC059021]|uniref:TetR/AcrR family transcriptional regulator n=1 Tax=Amycolatopsis sp. NPDC059021 TaxID=3346704 RepID=UPI0036716B74